MTGNINIGLEQGPEKDTRRDVIFFFHYTPIFSAYCVADLKQVRGWRDRAPMTDMEAS
jgi:hypothetical protein